MQRIFTVLQYIFITCITCAIIAIDISVVASSALRATFMMSYIVVIVAALRLPMRTALILALVFGFIIDTFQTAVFGVYMITHIAIVFSVVLLRNRWFKQPSVAVWLVLSFLVMCISIATQVILTYFASRFVSSVILVYADVSVISIALSWLLLTIGVSIGSRIVRVSDRIIII